MTTLSSSSPSSCPIGKIGDKLTTLDTPCLVVNRPSLMKNIETMNTYVRGLRSDSTKDPDIWLRPHAKTHKSPHLAKILMDSDPSLVKGICCQKLDEVDAMINR